MDKRYYLVFKGRVQGVGFRYFAMNAARKCALTGWVRNLSNGDVDMEIQGDVAKLDQCIAMITAGSRWIRVDDYAQKTIPLDDSEKDFRVRF